MKFCMSHADLDEDLKFTNEHALLRATEDRAIKERIVDIKASMHQFSTDKVKVFKDQQFFTRQKQLLQQREQTKKLDGQQYFNDIIEDEPIQIDIKINGLQKVRNIPIEMVGVYSMKTVTNKNEDMNILVNINTQGKQRIISFES